MDRKEGNSLLMPALVVLVLAIVGLVWFGTRKHAPAVSPGASQPASSAPASPDPQPPPEKSKPAPGTFPG